MKLEHHTFKFNVNGKPKQLDIVHNLKENGLDIEAAFTNWCERTSTFTEWNFCNYITSKDKMNIKAMPKIIFDRL